MNKIFITSAVAIMAAIPSFAETGIPAGTNNPGCTEPVLGVSSGTTNLNAEYDPNTINLDWYDGDTKLNVQTAAQTCTYDGTITIPSTNPIKNGYTFGGWKLRAINIFAGLDTSINGIGAGYKSDSRGEHGAISENTDTYGLTSDQTWATEFSYGTVKGMASCVSTLPSSPDEAYLIQNLYTILGGDSDAIAGYESIAGTAKAAKLQQALTALANEDMTTATSIIYGELLSPQTGSQYSTSSTGQYCYCAATNYTPLNGNTQSIASPAWVFGDGGYDGAADCAIYCAGQCAVIVQSYPGFRAALFGAY